MATMKSFDKYVVRIYGNTKIRVGSLMCYSANSFVGRIDFYSDSATTIPQDYLRNYKNPTREHIVLNMPMSRFDPVMSTVRAENPLHLFINVDGGTGSSTRGHGHLATTEKEPVAEEEDAH